MQPHLKLNADTMVWDVAAIHFRMLHKNFSIQPFNLSIPLHLQGDNTVLKSRGKITTLFVCLRRLDRSKKRKQIGFGLSTQ